MFQRRTSGSVVCPSCGSLVGVRDDKCYTCGRANPGLWGFAPALRQLGTDLGFVPIVIGGCSVLYVLTLLASGRHSAGGRRLMSFLSPSVPRAVPVRGERRHSRLPVRPLVDRAERGLAARQAAAHPVQHDVGAPARTGHRRDRRPSRTVIIYTVGRGLRVSR